MNYLQPILLETLKLFLEEQRHELNRVYARQSVATDEAESRAYQREIDRRLGTVKSLETLIQGLSK